MKKLSGKTYLGITCLALIQLLPAQFHKSGSPTRVMTFNIYHGATLNGDFDLDRIAGIINDVQPDLVALQEVDVNTVRVRGMDLAKELGTRTGLNPVFGPAMKFDGGHYGNAVLSRRPVLSSETIALPSSPNREPRAALVITTTGTEGDTVCFIATHLDHKPDNSERLAQAKAINGLIQAITYPAILAGDLNDTPGSDVLDIFGKEWQGTYDEQNTASTFPSSNPNRKIDYIMFRPADSWQVISTKVVPDSVASDHCAYWAVLKLLH